MHASVRERWVEFNEPLEGLLNLLYADKKGLVTTGMGNLVDPIALAIRLPWRMPDGELAHRACVVEAWHAVKNDPLCATKGWKHARKLAKNIVRLNDDDVRALVFSKLEQNDAALAKRFADWEERPEGVQLAVHSMAWAAGSNVFDRFPKWSAAFRAHDYATCAEQCKLSPNQGTLKTRNRLNRELFLAASAS